MTSGALTLFRAGRHRGRRPSLSLILVDWWFRNLLPYLLPAAAGPDVTCGGCLAPATARRRADDGRHSCLVCARPAARRHLVRVSS